MRLPQEFIDHPLPFPDLVEYRAFCRHVVDGDTFDFLVDLGLHQYSYITVRLANVDTPEIFQPKSEYEREEGYKAKKLVEDTILDKPAKIITHRHRTTFGRYIADVYYWQDDEWYDLKILIREHGLDWIKR